MPPQIVHSKTTTSLVRNSISRSSLRRAFVLITLALAWFVPPKIAQAADGGLTGFNTAEGAGALNQIATGVTGNDLTLTVVP